MTKITHAPKEVIDELDEMPLWYIPADLLGRVANDDGTSINEWLHVDPRLIGGKQLAIINHVFGNECLQPEREPRWYVVSADDDGECVVYFKTDLNIIDFINYGDVIPYEKGMSKQLADAIVAEVGGEKVEVK